MNTGENKTGKRVVVGLTGRVGSSVAAFLLKKQGFDVIGMSIVTNVNDNFSDPKYFPKCHVEDLDAINEFCNSLKIPFYATDGKSQFEAEVIDPLLENKLIGSANSSCFNCTEMRIKIMYDKMKKLKANYFATGHFGKIHKGLNVDDYFVHSNNDHLSDQSYLLSNIDTKYLKHLMLPLGELRIEEVRKIAQKFNLKIPSDSKKFDFCFKEKKSYEHYIEKRIPKSMIRDGQIVDVDTENYHGDHEGMINHYVTEDNLDFKGVNQSEHADIEIVGYDFEKATIQIGSRKNLSFEGTQLIRTQLSPSLEKLRPIHCFVKTRYSTEMTRATLFFKNNKSVQLDFDSEIYPLISGDTFVIYDRAGRNAKVIGHGTIGRRGGFSLVDRVEEFKPKKDEQTHETKSIFRF